jgi:hypothetical protein
MTIEFRIEILTIFGTLKYEDNLLEVSGLLECYTVSMVVVLMMMMVVEKERQVPLWCLMTRTYL